MHADSGPARKGRSVSFRLSTDSVQHSIHTDDFRMLPMSLHFFIPEHARVSTGYREQTRAGWRTDSSAVSRERPKQGA